MLPLDYLAENGDISIQEVRSDHFTLHRFWEGEWIQLSTLSAEEALAAVAPMQFLGETRSGRLYYRPTGESEK